MGSLLCALCHREMRAAAPVRTEAPPLRAIYSAAVFGGAWRQAIHALKYESQFAVAPVLAALLPPAGRGRPGGRPPA
ncbi:MAG: hypothetical protein M5R40_15180 [Anaerolineae bacterium]|nr:hypothetical protein [Anaerolineae bacterium]